MSPKFQTEENESISRESTEQSRLPTPLYTYIFIGSISAVFVIQCVTGNALSSAIVSDERSIRLAGFDKQVFLRSHEYWRILTGACVHGGIIHFMFNAFAFNNLGRIFEMLSNRAHLAIVFLLSVIGGNLLSLYYLPEVPSIGASGGIVGLLGYLTIYAFRRRQFISAAFRKSLLMNIGFMLIVGLALIQVVDNFGHIGGLITGATYAFLQIPSDAYIDPRASSSAVKFIGLAALSIYIAACCFSILLILRVV
jgi:membrane associated rhomboid family serine protease